MTVLFVEGFDHQNAPADMATGDDWTAVDPSVAISATFARFTGKGAQLSRASTAALSKNLPSNQSNIIVGMAVFLPVSASSEFFMRFSKGGTPQFTIDLQKQAGGKITVWSGNFGGTSLGQTAALSNLAQWNYFEFEVVVSTTVGSVKILQNGSVVLNLTGVNTDPTATGLIDAYIIDSTDGANAPYIDDHYVSNQSGSAPWNAPLGTANGAYVETTFPASNGTVAFTPNANTNWQQVSETAMDGDTSYNFDPTLAAQDLFNVGALVNVPVTVYAVAVRSAARIDSVSAVVLENVINSGGTSEAGHTQNLASTYAYQTDIFELDPNTSASWTGAAINALQIGYNNEAL